MPSATDADQGEKLFLVSPCLHMMDARNEKTRHGGFFIHYHLSAQALAFIAIVSVSEIIGDYSAITLTADGPLAPFSIENSTFWPSSKV